jgi:hypothetical protein
MTIPMRCLSLAVLLGLAACSAVETSSADKPAAPAEPAAKPAKTPDEQKAEQDKKAEERAAKEKELRLKRRELDYAKVEQQTGDIDRQVRALAVEASLQKARLEAQKARKELDLFLSVQRQKDLDESKLGLDRMTWHAEHQKDELGELESMYKEEEFAKATKELVLKRGRRSMEAAERELQLQRTGNELLTKHTLPDRERDLRQKVADTALELQKAELEVQKARLEIDLGKRKAGERIEDLEREVQELTAKLAKDAQS